MKWTIDILQMPLFFSLSGYLFVITHQKHYGLLRLLKNKARRLLVPYLGIGILWLLPIRMAVGFPRYSDMSILDFIRESLNNSPKACQAQKNVV